MVKCPAIGSSIIVALFSCKYKKNISLFMKNRYEMCFSVEIFMKKIYTDVLKQVIRVQNAKLCN